MPGRVQSFPFTSGQVAGSTTGEVTYCGYSLRESSGSAAAVVRLRDGTVSGAILDEVQLPTSTSHEEFYPPGEDDRAIAANGVYCELVSGAVEGSVRVSI